MDLFVLLASEYPNPAFVAKAFVGLAGAIGKCLPAERRLVVIQAMLDQACELGARWQ